MKQMRYTVAINAPVATVWSTMLEDATYRQWTEGFAPGCYYSGDWKQGSKILFLAPGEGGDSGMVSRIKENKHHEFISIEHLGIVGNGIEDTTSEEAKAWAGALENYTFREKERVTELLIELKGNIPDEFVKMFDAMWPEALNKLKSLSEE